MKAELIPTVLYAEGRPRDVGTDRKLANLLNVLIDRKTAHQSPWLVNGGITNQNGVHFLRPIFFGTEHLSATVERFVTVAPLIRSSTGGLATFTVTLTNTLPTYAPGQSHSGNAFTPSFSGKYVQETWTTTNTTWTLGAEATLTLGVKDLELGFAFLVMEDSGGLAVAETRGLAKCIEGVRGVS